MQESDSEDSLWGDSDESESSSSDEEGRGLGQLTLDYFRKKVPAEGDAERKRKEKAQKRERIKAAEMEDGEGWEEVPSKGGMPSITPEKPKLFPKDTEINLEVVLKKQNELVAAQGKKGTDRMDQIDLLVELRSIAQQNNLGIAIDAKILFNIVSAIFNYNPNIATCMKSEMFEKCIASIEELLTLLSDNHSIIAAANVDEDGEHYTGVYTLFLNLPFIVMHFCYSG
jgi:translation initiation factor 3 subunit C